MPKIPTYIMLLLMMIIIIIIIIVILILKPNQRQLDKTTIIKTLLRQSARWSTAAEQDQNPLVAVLHANYGVGYLWALKDIATDQEIEKSGKINIIRFRDEIVRVQDEATMKMIKVCPEYGPKKTYLTEIAKEG